MDDEALDALTRNAQAVATARAFAARAQAERVVLLIDPGDESRATMVDCAADGAIVLTEGDRSWEIPAAAPVPAVPLALPEVRPAPPTAIAFDPETGELEAPLGAVAVLGRSVLALARAFGGRSVATADFATREPGLPLTIAAREGDPLVVAAGDSRFVLPPEALGG